MTKLTSNLTSNVKYYVSAIKRAVTFYLKNLGAAIVGRNILDKVNNELRDVLTDFAAENIRLNNELKKIAKTKPVKKKDK